MRKLKIERSRYNLLNSWAKKNDTPLKAEIYFLLSYAYKQKQDMTKAEYYIKKAEEIEPEIGGLKYG